MKTVVLDGFAANPGDLSWDFLGEYGDYEVYDRTPDELVITRAADADIIILNKNKITAQMLGSLPKLKLISVLATGYNVVDCKACSERGITVTNVPSYSTSAVAQLTMSYILGFVSRVAEHSASVLSGGWAANPDFSYSVAPRYELEGKTLGIIGYGAIGRKVSSLALAFGMKVLAVTAHPEKYPDAPVTFTSLSEMLAKADFVSLHTPLTPETDRLVNAEFISGMKEGAYLINTSRGGEVDEHALADALNSGRLAGAAVDVLSTEPPKADNPLLKAKNIVITPHIAWSAFETRQRLFEITRNNISSFAAGNPVNVVNK